VIGIEIDESDVEDRLPASNVSVVYYPFYSSDEMVYDPILSKEVE